MTTINSDCLLIIFKMLNLNDRTNLRLTCKLFRKLCDSIKIKKLIIFEKEKSMIMSLPNTNEFYNYEDAVSVYDLNKFFSNQIILNQIQLIRLLVIDGYQYSYSEDCQIIHLNKFDKLEYLFLNSLIISNGEILKSPIQKLILNFTIFSNDYKLETFELFSFSDLNSVNLKYLNVNCELDETFFLKCIQFNKLTNLEELDFLISNFNDLLILNCNFVNLRTINCVSKNNFINQNIDLVNIIDQLRENINLIYFGIQLNRTTAQIAKELFVALNSIFLLADGKLIFLNSVEAVEILNEYGKIINLIEFYKLIDWFYFIKLEDSSLIGSIDRNLFNKFIGLEVLHLTLSNYLIINFNDFFSSFYSIKNISALKLLNLDTLSNYGNELLDLIPNLQSINSLTIENFNKINFDFLFKLPNLTSLKLILYYTIPNSIVIELLKHLPKLYCLNMIYKRTNELTDDKLDQFKELIIRLHLDELKIEKFNFNIINNKQDEIEFIRICLFRGLKDDFLSNFQPPNEREKIFKMIKHKDNELT